MLAAHFNGRWRGLVVIALLCVPVCQAPVCQANENEDAFQDVFPQPRISFPVVQVEATQNVGANNQAVLNLSTAEKESKAKGCDKCEGTCTCTPKKNCGECEGECKCTSENAKADVSVATHKQVGLIPVNFESVSQAKVSCFCLALDGQNWPPAEPPVAL